MSEANSDDSDVYASLKVYYWLWEHLCYLV